MVGEDRRRDLRDMLDELDRQFSEFEKEMEEALKSMFFGDGRPSMPFVAGFAFNVGDEGRPSLQVFGNTPMSGDGYRSPICEQVVDEKNGVLRLILEMPGVEKGDITVDATEDRCVVTASRGERRYRADLELKLPIRADSGRAEYKNGMLEISFSLKDKANKGFRKVNVV